MKLSEAILNCNDYPDTDETIYMLFAKKVQGQFVADSESIMLPVTLDEAEMNIIDLANSKCPGYEYFLEVFTLRDFFEDLNHSETYKTVEDKIRRVIYYAEFDA